MFVLYFLLFSITSVSVKAEENLVLVGRQVCQAYKGFEHKFKCEQDGYFIGYGLRYCNRFYDKEYYAHFDNNGKSFVDCAGPCLVDELRKFLKLNPKSGCSSIADKAFDTHANCYIKCGFCQACRTNKDALRRVYQLKDMISIRTLDTAQKILRQCGGIFKGVFDCLTG